ncbi:MAG TPA: hypothetical protein VH988_19830 [Thermoanaerobaculia bacterium]|jgi:hypothetical protein|nr:hypothetical protein [Thermoanaerobaculia bacterium]
MKKKEDDESQEMVSLNQELFSLEAGDLVVEELERRLELAIGAAFTCGTFTCGSFSNCNTFGCANFGTKG